MTYGLGIWSALVASPSASYVFPLITSEEREAAEAARMAARVAAAEAYAAAAAAEEAARQEELSAAVAAAVEIAVEEARQEGADAATIRERADYAAQVGALYAQNELLRERLNEAERRQAGQLEIERIKLEQQRLAVEAARVGAGTQVVDDMSPSEEGVSPLVYGGAAAAAAALLL